jgi:hypothetical protein
MVASPLGDDANDGLSTQTPVATLSRAHAVVGGLINASASSDIEVRIAPATYRGQAVGWSASNTMEDQSVTLMPWNETAPSPIFDGCVSPTSCGHIGFLQLKLASHQAEGVRTNLYINRLRIQNYTSGVSLAGSRDSVLGFVAGNQIHNCTFDRIGNIYNLSLYGCCAAIDGMNTINNSFIGNTFIDIVGTGAHMHVVYLASYSSNNVIAHNMIAGANGDPIRFRDSSSHNRVFNNTFGRAGRDAAVQDWYCDHDQRPDCTKKTSECASWGNVVVNNTVHCNYTGGVLKHVARVWPVGAPDHTKGCLAPPAGTVRFQVEGNRHTRSPQCSLQASTLAKGRNSSHAHHTLGAMLSPSPSPSPSPLPTPVPSSLPLKADDDASKLAGNKQSSGYGSALIELDPGVPGLQFDYPPEARAVVLDLLFLPNFAASLQVLKVEIGGDGDSTQGTEASHEPERGELQPKAGYELWVAGEARKRNPEILIYGLCWNFPSWVRHAPEGFGVAGARYMADWVEVAASQNITVDVLGAWQNETPFNGTMVVGLRRELDRRGFGRVRLSVGELRGGETGFGEVPVEIAADPKLDAATAIVGLHYASTESPPALNTSRWQSFWALEKPLWASEDYSTYSDSVGGKCLAKLFNRNFVDANITATFVWDLFWASFDGLACSGQGLIWCAEPWSGKFGLPDTIWAAAHTTQFTDRSWHYISKDTGGAGDLPGRQPGSTGGTFVSLVSKHTQEVTMVFETMDNNGSACAPGNAGWNVAVQESNAVKVCLAHTWCSALKLPPVFNVFRTNVAQGERFVKLADVTVDAQCCFHANLTANSIQTFSTKGGAKKGAHPDATVRPVEGADNGCGVATARLAAPFPFPYGTNFTEPERFRDFPRYLSDIDGVFRVKDEVLRQQMLEPSSAFGGVYPTSVLGDKSWADFTVAVDATLPLDANASDYVSVVARIGHGYLFGPPGGYSLQLAADRTWRLLVHPTKALPQRLLVSGKVGSGGVWRELRLTVRGTVISASIDGVEVGRGTDGNWSNGLAGLGSGFHNASFRNFRVDALDKQPPLKSDDTANTDDTAAVSGCTFFRESWRKTDSSTTKTSFKADAEAVKTDDDHAQLPPRSSTGEYCAATLAAACGGGHAGSCDACRVQSGLAAGCTEDEVRAYCSGRAPEGDPADYSVLTSDASAAVHTRAMMVVDSSLPALEASAAAPPPLDWVAAGNFCSCMVGTCCGCSDEGGPPYREMILLAGNATRLFALRGPTPFVAAERPSSEVDLGGHVLAAVTIRTDTLIGLDTPQREAVLVLSGRQQARLTLLSIGAAACERMTIAQLTTSTLLDPPVGSEYVAVAAGANFGGALGGGGGGGSVAVLLSRALDPARRQMQQKVTLLGFEQKKFSVIKQVPLLGPRSGGHFVTIGPALSSSPGRPAGIFALWKPLSSSHETTTVAHESRHSGSSVVLCFELPSAVVDAVHVPLQAVWNTSVDLFNGTKASFLVGDVLGEQQQQHQHHQPGQFLAVWVAQTGGGRSGLTLTAVSQPEFVTAEFPTLQRVLSIGGEAGRRPWRAVTVAPWLTSSAVGELQLIGTVEPPAAANASDFVVSLVVYGNPRHFAVRARQLEGARSHFGWPATTVADEPGQLNRSHANTNFFAIGSVASYTNLIDHLIDTVGFHVDGRQVVVILTLFPTPYGNGRVPPNDPRTAFNETAAFDKNPCAPNAERGAACGQHYENYAAWGEVSGRLGLQFSHLGGMCLEEFENDTESGQVHHSTLAGSTTAEMTANMRRYSPGMNFVGGFYFTESGCHTGDSCATAKPLCCGQTRLFTYRPDLALTLDTVLYWFRNDGALGGVNPCAPGGWSCKALPPPYSQECIKTPGLCGCVPGPMASECPWGSVCKTAPWGCAAVVGGKQGVGIGVGGLCTAGHCAEQTISK